VPVQVNVATNFDASSSCPGATAGSGCEASSNTIVTYAWTFGDGSSGTGRTISHAFSSAGSYTVTLTVTNDGGKSASTTQSLSVTVGANPTADFVFSPSNPVVGQNVFFNGSTSRAAPGRTLVSYVWNWGDGETGTGVFQDHDFTASGTYNVTLTVTDDTGLSGTSAKTVSVGTGNPTASMTIIKNVGGMPLNIQADGSGSTATGGATITTYAFNWGDGSPLESGSAQVRQHNYALTTGAGTYTVRLTVTDSLNRTGFVTQSVTVP
jgi:PKD repeat protein